MSKLGDALTASPAASSSPATKASRLLAALASSRVLEPITIPGLGVTALMTLVGAERLVEIEGEVAKQMHERGLGDSEKNAVAWELARATRTLADAILDDDPALRAAPPAFGTPAEWGRLSREQVVELWRMYDELSEQHDPGKDNEFTPEEAELVRIAVQKKSPTLLRAFGAKRLSAFLLSISDLLASSPTVKPSHGDSSSES